MSFISRNKFKWMAGNSIRNTTYKIKDFLPQGKHWNDQRFLQQQKNGLFLRNLKG